MAVPGRYLYCVIPCSEKREFGKIGVGDDPGRVYTLHYQDLALVVSNVPVKAYDPTRKNALAHEKVIAEAMREFPVVPMSFGLVCQDEYKAKMLLSQNYTAFKEKLELFSGKMEVGLKVWWKKESFQPEMFRHQPRLTELKRSIEGKASGSAYMLAVEFGRTVENAANELRSKYEQEIFKPLQQLSADARLNKLINELMVFNSAFLIEKAREHEFDLKVNDLYLAHQEILQFKYTGPWPPYNFVDIRISDV